MEYLGEVFIDKFFLNVEFVFESGDSTFCYSQIIKALVSFNLDGKFG